VGTRIDHAINGALLAIEIEPAVAVKHRRHYGKYALVRPSYVRACHAIPLFIAVIGRVASDSIALNHLKPHLAA
jgi:hypothetical protein